MAAVGIWSFASALLLGSFGFLLTGELGDRRLLLPGASTDGHYQMELGCNECHGSAFAGESALESACVRCHGPELTAAENSHPKSKFTDPRNADRVARLDARRCVTCHREHWPQGTGELGVSVQQDHCSTCHADIGRERASHAALSWSSCASVGCHRFHDNRASREKYLVEHAGEAAFLPSPTSEVTAGSGSVAAAVAANAATSAAESAAAALATSAAPVAAAAPAVAAASGSAPLAPRALSAADADAPGEIELGSDDLAAWAASAHAKSGVNCRGCHESEGSFRKSVPTSTCGRCHADERAGWVSGKHGLREGLGLEAMRPELARQPMQANAPDEALSCSSCHRDHGFDRQRAAVESCQGCHADDHTRAYAQSPHARLWQQELAGMAPPGSGVSCATCHLPRLPHASGRERVQHNPNDNLRPRDKMIRGVCLDCHGLGFSIDALADEALVERNFAGTPVVHVPSIDWAVARARAQANQAGRGAPGSPPPEPWRTP